MGVIEVRAPFDGAPIGKVEMVNAAQVEAALAGAYALYRNRDSWIPLHKRIDILTKDAKAIGDVLGKVAQAYRAADQAAAGLLTIDPGGDAAPIVVRQHSLNPPPIDAKVRIAVVGSGVVLK